MDAASFLKTSATITMCLLLLTGAFQKVLASSVNDYQGGKSETSVSLHQYSAAFGQTRQVQLEKGNRDGSQGTRRKEPLVGQTSPMPKKAETSSREATAAAAAAAALFALAL